MKTFRLLLVEDDAQEIKSCEDAIVLYKDKTQREVKLVTRKSVKEALKELDNSFDGAIIDLKLSNEGNEGNEVIKKIKKELLRMPVVILTGTPADVDPDFAHIKVFKRGEKGSGYFDLLDYFWGIYATGLMRVMGDKGKIEKALSTVFWEISHQLQGKWMNYGKEKPSKTETALLRHTLSHLLHHLDNEGGAYYPEEFYLTLTDKIWTGSIVKEKGGKKKFVVMNPACDLVTRNKGKPKTDNILIVKIDSPTQLFLDRGVKNKKNVLKEACNKKPAHYHWLPETDFFEGGFLNFRKLSSLPREDFYEEYKVTKFQISPSFVKDIVARFSSYYARQGQPEIDSKYFIDECFVKTPTE